MGHDHSHGHSHGHSHDHDDHSSHSSSAESDHHDEAEMNEGAGIAVPLTRPRMSEEQLEVLRRLKCAMMLCGSFFVVEVLGGYISGSLAVLSDAAHLFADLASFAVAIAAAHLAALPTTDQHTFGLKRAESLAALLSMISLALVSIYLCAEAIRRLIYGNNDVDGKVMSGVAFIGVLVNIALALVLGVENHIHLPGAHDHDHSHDHGHGHGHGHCQSEDENHGHAEERHGHGHGHDHRQEVDKPCHDDDHSHGHEHGHGHGHGHGLDPHQEEDHHSDDDDHSHEHEHGHSHDGKDENAKCSGHDHSHGHKQEGLDHSHGHKHEGHDHSHGHKHEALPFVPKEKNGYEAIHMDELAPPQSNSQKEKKPLKNINLQAAYLHVFGDLMQSLGVLIAGLAIWYNPKWTIVDPICTLFFCSFVFYSTLGVLRHSVAVLLQEMPPDLNWQRIYDAITSVEGVENVHDLHVWSISHGDPALAVHCSCGDSDPQLCMRQISSALNKMGITHVTIQIQQGNGECITCHHNAGCDAARLIIKRNSSANHSGSGGSLHPGASIV